MCVKNAVEKHLWSWGALCLRHMPTYLVVCKVLTAYCITELLAAVIEGLDGTADS